MKILYLLSAYPQLSETFIEHEIKELQRQHEVEILSIRPTRSKSVNISNTYNPLYLLFKVIAHVFSGRSTLRIHNIKIIVMQCRKAPAKSLKFLYLLISADYLKSKISKFNPDKVVVHFLYSPSLFNYLSRDLKYRTVYRLHTPNSYLIQDVQDYEIRHATAILTISNKLGSYFQQRYPSIKTRTIRQSLDSAVYDYKQVIRPDGQIRLIASGRFVEKKGFLNLIEACRLLKEQSEIGFILNIFGDGHLKTAYLNKIKNLGLHNMVVVHPWLPHHELLSEMAKHNYLVVPSEETKYDVDGIPTVIPEAMLQQVGVIACDVGSISEIVNEQTGVLISETGPQAICSGIIEAFQMGDAWREIKERAKKHIEKEYQSESII